MRKQTPHAFVSDHVRDGFGLTRCLFCGLPKANAVHRLPRVSDDVRAETARRVGEREHPG